VLRVIKLNNNMKILLVSFVHHIELQNFLNAPRRILWPGSLMSLLTAKLIV